MDVRAARGQTLVLGPAERRVLAAGALTAVAVSLLVVSLVAAASISLSTSASTGGHASPGAAAGGGGHAPMTWEEAQAMLGPHGPHGEAFPTSVAGMAAPIQGDHGGPGPLAGGHGGDPADGGHGHDDGDHRGSGPREDVTLVDGARVGLDGTRVAYEPATPDGTRGSAIRFHDADADHGHAAGDCAPTAEQQAYARRLLAATTEAIEQYDNNPAQALRDGFLAYPVAFTKMFHMFSYGRFEDDHELNPAQVESFMYAMTDEGLKAVGAMYVFDDREVQPPNPTGCILQWHRHEGAVEGLVTSGDLEHPTQSAWMAHLWTYGFEDPWHDGDGTEQHAWFAPYRAIPAICGDGSFCI